MNNSPPQLLHYSLSLYINVKENILNYDIIHDVTIIMQVPELCYNVKTVFPYGFLCRQENFFIFGRPPDRCNAVCRLISVSNPANQFEPTLHHTRWCGFCRFYLICSNVNYWQWLFQYFRWIWSIKSQIRNLAQLGDFDITVMND